MFFFCFVGQLPCDGWITHQKPHNNYLQAVRAVKAVRIGFIFTFFFCLEQTVPWMHGILVVFRFLRSIKFNINCWTDESSLRERAHFKKCIQSGYCMLVFSQLLYLWLVLATIGFFSDFVAYTCYNFADKITYTVIVEIFVLMKILKTSPVSIFMFWKLCRLVVVR